MTKMNYLYRHRPDEALKTYKELLGYTKVSSLLLCLVMRRAQAAEQRYEELCGKIHQ